MTQTSSSTSQSAAGERLAGKASPYRVARIERIDMPDGGEGKNWYRYILENGRSTITGQRRGSKEDVVAHAERYAQQLNARGFSGQSVWTPRSKK
jgi:hypothetical protein